MPKLKYRYEARQDVPPEHQMLYLDRDGACVLDVEGAVDAAEFDAATQRGEAAERERNALEERLADLQVTQAAVNAAARRGVRPHALTDVALRARAAFRFENGGIKPRDAGSSGAPLDVDGWMDRLTAEAPHLFEPNRGTGSIERPAQPYGAAGNPWHKDQFNLTRQGQLFRADADKAQTLARAAGKK